MASTPPEVERPALLCITPSPAIDRTAHVPRISSGDVLRPAELVALPGGKGVNAARAAARLGARVITTGIAGGHAGRWIVEALEDEGLEPRWAVATAESRTTYVTVDDAGGSVIVYERPTAATAQEFEAFLQLLEHELLPISGRAIVAGSVPSGIGPDGHRRIIEVCRRAGRPLLVDASGDGLQAALEAQPDMVKIGLVEAIEAGVVVDGATASEAAEALVERGATTSVVTDGARAVAASSADTTWLLTVPMIDVVNPVGSGDAFNAALSLALMEDAPMEVALRSGVGAGSANALALGAGMLEPEVARGLERSVTVTATRR